MKYTVPVLICFFLLGLTTTYAQTNTITGSVRSADSGETLPGTNVFFNGTTIGTQADTTGNFTIKNIPGGTYKLVFSFVGFKRYITTLSFPNPKRNEINVLLQPKENSLNEVTVKADTREWQKNLKKFERHFLGYSNNADETEILNPEVLFFENKDGQFIATAQEPLEIKNEALGYNIMFYLNTFILKGQAIKTGGYSKYELMSTKDEERKKEWQKEREEAYNGSYRHFINALTKGKLRNEGFEISFDNTRRVIAKRFRERGINREIEYPSRLFTYTGIGQIQLAFYKKFQFLRIDYLEEHPEQKIARRAKYNRNYHQISFIELPAGKAIINVGSGSEKAPYRAHLHGYWGWSSRIPDLLPKDYDP